MGHFDKIQQSVYYKNQQGNQKHPLHHDCAFGNRPKKSTENYKSISLTHPEIHRPHFYRQQHFLIFEKLPCSGQELGGLPPQAYLAIFSNQVSSNNNLTIVSE
ncbi:hypothetical protein [Janthinobacterium fluminis]|uniref:Uncharacterized protein n=1 Tax=Janthinobacterium fluminis TaxID=2987524 RepID=A0ABT5K023_9BURK|nr:hypothetical protein [Janthinobacterium fluminis]MDC8757107.1 hypothetical protein [Janthinobacterium fluminis]